MPQSINKYMIDSATIMRAAGLPALSGSESSLAVLDYGSGREGQPDGLLTGQFALIFETTGTRVYGGVVEESYAFDITLEDTLGGQQPVTLFSFNPLVGDANIRKVLLLDADDLANRPVRGDSIRITFTNGGTAPSGGNYNAYLSPMAND